MSATNLQVVLDTALSDDDKQSINELLALLPKSAVQTSRNAANPVSIKKLVDGRRLACPMPLLKTKVALRDVSVGESLYIVATDPNSQADITAFCQQSTKTSEGSALLLTLNQTTPAAAFASSFDTIYHFIITKTDSK